MGNICCDSHAIGPHNFHGRSADSRCEMVAPAERVPNAFDLLPRDIHDSRSALKRRSFSAILKHPWLTVDHKHAGQGLVVFGGE